MAEAYDCSQYLGLIVIAYPPRIPSVTCKPVRKSYLYAYFKDMDCFLPCQSSDD